MFEYSQTVGLGYPAIHNLLVGTAFIDNGDPVIINELIAAKVDHKCRAHHHPVLHVRITGASLECKLLLRGQLLQNGVHATGAFRPHLEGVASAIL